MSNNALTIVPRSLPEVETLAETLAKSTLLPDALKGKAPDIVVSILAGAELGLSPMAAIRGVHVVQGKPLLSADTMVGLVLASGLCEYFMCVEESDASVTYETKRKNAPKAQRCTWSLDDSKRAAIHTKDNHRLFPRQMMKARCKAILARDAYPDVLAGVYDTSEVDQAVPLPTLDTAAKADRAQRQADAIDAEIVSETAAPTVDAPELAAIDAAPTYEDLQKLAPTLSTLTGPLKVAARKRYGAKLAQFEAAVAANGTAAS